MSLLAAAPTPYSTALFSKWPAPAQTHETLGSIGVGSTVLPQAVVGRLAACAARYEKQSALPEKRRRRVGVLVRGATSAQRLAIAAFFAHRLDLQIAMFDSGHVEGAHDDDAADYVRPLVENTRRVALVEGLTGDLDARLRNALVWSSRDVLVVACAEGSELLDARLAQCFAFVVDCRAKVRSMPSVTALRV